MMPNYVAILLKTQIMINIQNQFNQYQIINLNFNLVLI